MRLIDADALIEKLRQSPYTAEGPFGNGYSERYVIRMIERMPTVKGGEMMGHETH